MDFRRHGRSGCAAALLLLFLISAGCRDGVAPYAPLEVEPLEGAVRRLTFGYGRDTGPSWAPGGDTLYFATTSFSYFPNRPHLLLRVATTGGTASVLEAPAHVVGPHGGSFALTTPVPSPDGTRLAYVHLYCADVQCHTVQEARVRVRLLGAPGTAAHDVGVWLHPPAPPGPPPLPVPATMILNAGYRPSWSPDGTRIVFADTGGLRIWSIPLDSLNRVPGTAGAQWAAWSPDGGRIAFTRVHGADTSIVAIDTDGGDALVLAPGREPAWSPDGQTVYHSSAGFLRRVPRNGGAVQAVPGTLDARMPAPSPDGRWLAFTRAKGAQPPLNNDLDIWVIDLTAQP